MAFPLAFPQSNRCLKAPEGMSKQECLNLPVCTDGKLCVSKWKLTPEELERVKETGVVWLMIWSGAPTQPPVYVTSDVEFAKA